MLKKIISQGIWWFIFCFLVIFFGSKYLGEGSRSNLSPTHSLSWRETINDIPQYLGISLLMTLGISYILWSSRKKAKSEAQKMGKQDNEMSK